MTIDSKSLNSIHTSLLLHIYRSQAEEKLHEDPEDTGLNEATNKATLRLTVDTPRQAPFFINRMRAYIHFGWIILSGFIAMLNSFPVLALEWTVEGSIMEKETHKPLQSVRISVQDNASISAISDEKGRFHLNLPGYGKYTLKATLPKQDDSDYIEVQIAQDTPPPFPTFYMHAPETLREMVVTAESSTPPVSKNSIQGKVISKLAGSSGDPLRALQSLPGVASVDGSSAPAVRGSGPGDNLYYVDGLTVGKLFHYNSLSVLNADLIKDFDLYSAAFGPHYGDITGAVIDVALREPRKDRVGGKVDVNLMGADFLIEGPRTSDQSFYLAARRSYIDLFVKQIVQDGVTIQIPNYWDYQSKYLWQLNDANRLTFHLQGAADILELSVPPNSDAAQHEPTLAGETSLTDASSMQGMMLESIISSVTYNKLALERTSHQSSNTVGTAGTIIYSQENIILRDQMRFDINEGHEISLGTELVNSKTKINANFKNAPCTQFDANCGLNVSRKQLIDDFSSNAWSLSVQDRKRVLDHLKLIGGVRRTAEDYLKRSYTEPRIGLEWEWSEHTLFTAGWGRHNQMPTGEQTLSRFGNPALDHIRAEHSVLGISQIVNEDWNWKTEAYYKKLSNLVISDPLLNYINAASGRAYGVELLIRKEATDRLSGWFVLNLAKSQRRNDVTGESFRFQYDQPVNTTLVGNYKLSDLWELGLKWNYHSGTPYTPIVGTKGTYSDGRPMPVYAGVNSDSLPTYHRLDLRVDRSFKFDQWKLNAYFELNDVYQRKNIVGYSYDNTYSTRKPVYSFVLPISFGIEGQF